MTLVAEPETQATPAEVTCARLGLCLAPDAIAAAQRAADALPPIPPERLDRVAALFSADRAIRGQRRS
jgi:hypothetical protein